MLCGGELPGVAQRPPLAFWGELSFECAHVPLLVATAMKIGPQPKKWLTKKARQGMRGYPVGTIAFYGPDHNRASKLAASVIEREGWEPEIRRWQSESGDVRTDEATAEEVATFFRQRSVRSVAMTDGIIGCPHEEGIDYPMGEVCPKCPYWAGRDRFAPPD